MDAEDLDDALGHRVEARRGGLVVEGVEVERGQALVVVVVIVVVVVLVVRRVAAADADAAGSARGDDDGKARAAVVARGRGERGLVLGVFAWVGCTSAAAAAAGSRWPSSGRCHRLLFLFFSFFLACFFSLQKALVSAALSRTCMYPQAQKRGGWNERAVAASGRKGMRLDFFFPP